MTPDADAAFLGALPAGADRERIGARIAHHLAVLGDGEGALLACSGGPDSTAMALLVAHVRPDLRVTLAYVAHGLRGSGDDEGDAAQVAAIAELLGVDHVVLPVNVGRAGGGVESDARDVRHAALEAEADRRGLHFVLHGHHADDQAETLLLRLVRGTGVDGLAGMAPVAGRRLRPLLEVRRDDLRRAARELVAERADAAAQPVPGLGREDPMNEDLGLARVRLRRAVLPELGRVGPDPVGALTRLAMLARDESDLLERMVDELRVTSPLVTFGPAVMIPSGPLRALPVALARRLVRAVLREAAGGTSGATRDAVTADGPDAGTVERLLRAPDGWRGTLPGPLDATVSRGWHIVRPAAATASDGGPDPAAAQPVPLDPSAADPVAVHTVSGIRLRARAASVLTLVAELPAGAPPGIDPARLTVRLHPEGIIPLGMRTRRDGDRIRTAAGGRSLGDVLREAGVPEVLRDLLPVVTGADDRPVWVPGVVVDADAHVPGVDP